MSTLDVLRGVTRRSVIEVRVLRGAGVSSDPVRVVTAYFDDEGNLLAEHDPIVVIAGHGRAMADELAGIPDPGVSS